MRRVLVLVVVAAALAVPSAQAAAPGPPDLSVKVTNAILEGKLHTAWTLLHPRQRAVTTEQKWTRCHATELAAMGRLKILGVEAATTKVGTAVFPPLGRIKVAVVAVTISYEVPGNPVAQSGTNTAYWTLDRGKWVGLLSPASYRALKAGRCP
jgi:hypothetical protein